MPTRRAPRRARRAPRRTFRRRVKRSRARQSLGMNVAGLFGAPTIRRSMRYIQNLTMTSTTGAIATNVFMANGLYDPDISGGGHQPRWFDQIMPYFNHFCVVGAKITVVFSPHSGTVPTIPITVGIAKRAVVGTESNAMEYQENGNCVWRSLPVDGSARTMSMTFSTRKFFGKKYSVDNYDLKGSQTANPLEQAFFHVFIDPVYGTESPVVAAQVLIDYIAVFSEPNTVAQS